MGYDKREGIRIVTPEMYHVMLSSDGFQIFNLPEILGVKHAIWKVNQGKD
jgi:hypothetical protein